LTFLEKKQISTFEDYIFRIVTRHVGISFMETINYEEEIHLLGDHTYILI